MSDLAALLERAPAPPDGAPADAPPSPPTPVAPAWGQAVLVAALVAIDPAGLGGVRVRSQAGPVRDRWLTHLRAFLPPDLPVRRVPLGIAEGRLLGGLDLAATLQAGKPIAERGVLADADGGLLVLAMAERLTAGTAAQLAAVLDRHEVMAERDGFTLRTPARCGMIAFDEGLSEDERPPGALLDRLAFRLDLDPIRLRETEGEPLPAEAVLAARERLATVTTPDTAFESLSAAAHALGIDSVRGPLLALKAARASAALFGRDGVDADDLTLAARLVLGPRATRLPAESPDTVPDPPEPPPEPPDGEPPPDAEDEPATEEPPLDDLVLEAARAAIPEGLLAMLKLGATRGTADAAGRAGAVKQGNGRGRPAGTRRGDPKSGQRLNVLETLRSAAPWQPIRRQGRSRTGRRPVRVEVRRDDFRITRIKHRTATTTIFVVDASGSAALQRLAEAKGAVELLLADCYVRRDQVALIAFRKAAAELLLPPTRSLVRAKRSLAGLPGGGATPLAAGIVAATTLAEDVRRRGHAPVVVLLTDGKANIGHDGRPGRPQAQADAETAGRALRLAGHTALLVDTAQRPSDKARRLADAMGATYLPLPYADARSLSQAVSLAAEAG